MSEVVGVGREIHITQMYRLTCEWALLVGWKKASSLVDGGRRWIFDTWSRGRGLDSVERRVVANVVVLKSTVAMHALF